MIEHSGSPLLVLGGPGTGKTTFLEERFLHLATSGVVEPHMILLLCGNRLYASRAREKLARRLPGQAAVEVPVYTWHGLAYHLVTRYHSELGFSELPVLLTAAEQWGTVQELLDGQDPNEWPTWGARLGERAFADEVADFCLRVEQQLWGPDELEELAQHRPDWSEVIGFAGLYRRHLLERSRLDYAQLIAYARKLLVDSPDVAGALKERFPHVLVDDGQDLGHAHIALLQELDTSNLVVAADPDCGIEAFRGAQPDWVLGFEKWFGPVRTEVLDKSHRLGAPLAPALLRLISSNESVSTHRAGKFAERKTDFECRQYASSVDEVESIARELKTAHLVEGTPWHEMAVLVSQPRFLLGPLQRAMELCDIPFQPLQGDRPLSSEPAVKCFLDLVRVALQTDEAPRLLPDLLTSPLIGMDFPVRRALEREAWRTRRQLPDVLEDAPQAEELRRLKGLVVEHQDRADVCFWEVYSTAAYYRQLEARACADRSDPANTAIDALVDFSHSLERFVERRRGGSVGEYLLEAARADFGADPWLPPAARSVPGVALSTFHGAKGREWEFVIVAGCLDSWIPKGKRAQGLFDPYALQVPDVATRTLEAVAEDRRTFYVAATRARSRVLFTVAPSNGARPKPSRFLVELAGTAPQVAPRTELPPVNLGELGAGLRRTLASPGSSAAETAAAVLALSEIPGIDPDLWYGKLDWTAGVTPLVTEQLRTSYSRLSVFENCGLQYVLQSVLGLDPSSTYSMKFGTWMHALFQSVHEGKIGDAETLRSEYGRLFDPTIFPNTTIARQFRRDGLRMLEVFWKNEAGVKDVIAERAFEIEFAGALLRGRIDRIDKKASALILTDYKTAKWAPSYTEAQSSLQLAIYHLAAKTDLELSKLGEPQLARLVYPGAFKPDGSHQVLTQNAEQAEKVIERLPEIIDKVRAEDFRPNPHADCHFCRMKPLCPLYPDGQELQA